MAVGRLGDGHSADDVERNLQEMRDFGFSEQAIALARAEAARSVLLEPLDIHPDNEVAVRLFLALQTQWRFTSRSTWQSAESFRTGLDYGVIPTTAQLEGLEVTSGDFQRLRILEAEALVAWNEERRRS